MPKTTTKKKTATSKSTGKPGIESRVSTLEAEVVEIKKKLTAAVERIEMIKSAVAEGRLDKL